MKRRIFTALLSVLLLALSACGQTGAGEQVSTEGQTAETSETTESTETAASGVPAGEELLSYEALYGKSVEETLDALNLKAEDAARQDEVSVIYDAARTIEGVSFSLTLNFSGESGFYGFTLNAGLPSDTEDLTGTVQKVYEDAAAQYGTPVTYEGLPEILSAQLEAGEHTGQEDWTVGEGSTCRMSVSDYEGQSVITLAYQAAAEE